MELKAKYFEHINQITTKYTLNKQTFCVTTLRIGISKGSLKILDAPRKLRKNP